MSFVYIFFTLWCIVYFLENTTIWDLIFWLVKFAISLTILWYVYCWWWASNH